MKQTIKYNYEPMNGFTEENIKDVNTVDIVLKNGSILVEETGFNHWYDENEKKLTPAEALVAYIEQLSNYINMDKVEWLDLSHDDKSNSDYIAKIEVTQDVQ